jgi:cytosine/adenosine deaminase-related metal-dependent hydrolase
MKLVTNGRLITRNASAQGYYEHGAVAFEGTKIVEVGEEAALRAKYPDAEIIDAKGGVIMPAFINAHTPPSPAAFPSSATTRRTSTKCSTAHGGPSTAT